jgi:hypothetical protein
LLAVVGAWGCLTHGRFRGEHFPGPSEAATAPAAVKRPVAFVWNSTEQDSLDGEIATTLPSGEAFTGKYQQIVAGEAVMSHGFREAWFRGWTRYGSFVDPWRHFPSGQDDELVVYNEGKVLAFLRGNRGTLIRCHFTLNDPAEGLAGGTSGLCQVSDGTLIDATMMDAQRLGRA